MGGKGRPSPIAPAAPKLGTVEVDHQEIALAVTVGKQSDGTPAILIVPDDKPRGHKTPFIIGVDEHNPSIILNPKTGKPFATGDDLYAWTIPYTDIHGAEAGTPLRLGVIVASATTRPSQWTRENSQRAAGTIEVGNAISADGTKIVNAAYNDTVVLRTHSDTPSPLEVYRKDDLLLLKTAATSLHAGNDVELQ